MKKKKQKIEENLTPTAAHLPEHGPIDETGREILLQVKNVDITFGKGDTAIVTDVKTGISFQVRRWAGGDHADVEPLTTSDTAAMCRIYGVSSAQQISDKNLYQRHPILVTLKGHSYAASMYGVPHNYPDGDTIPNNNFNGQFCIHFVNSRVHKSNKVDKDHQNAIMYAYENAARLLGIN